MGELWDVYTKDRRLTGKYLVSQRSADKDTDPLKWETVAGHAVSGDTSLDVAQRKDMYYPVNYGYVEGVIGGDGAEQDI